MNSERYPAYHCIDFRIDRRFIFDTKNLVIFFDIVNIYNRVNIWSSNYNDYDTRDRVLKYKTLPVGGVSIEFWILINNLLYLKMKFMKNFKLQSDRIIIGVLYLLMFAGGLWHVLGVFQTLMRFLAAPLLIVLSILVFGVTYKNISDKRTRNFLLLWAMFVIIGSFFIEWLGVKTDRIFGQYVYGETLKPILFEVPIAIGFAWLCMLLTSASVVQRILLRFSDFNMLVQGISISLLMVLFDIIMEPAAVKLGYWIWLSESIPIQNFFAWFVVSLLFALIGLRIGSFKQKLPTIVFHAYFAQLIYFVMVILK